MSHRRIIMEILPYEESGSGSQSPWSTTKGDVGEANLRAEACVSWWTTVSIREVGEESHANAP